MSEKKNVGNVRGIRGIAYDCENRKLYFDWEETQGMAIWKALSIVTTVPITTEPNVPQSSGGYAFTETLYEGGTSAYGQDTDWPGPGSGQLYAYVWFAYTQVSSDHSIECPGGGGEAK